MVKWLSFLGVLYSVFVTIVVHGQDADYPAKDVVEYVNLNNDEIRRQRALKEQGLQTLSPVILPEGRLENDVVAAGGIRGHLGWPHAVMIDSTIVLHIKNLFLLRSPDAGKTWKTPFFVENAPILAMVATKSGKTVAVSIDRERDKSFVHGVERSLSVLISTDRGKTWNRHRSEVNLPIGAQGLTSRIIEHPQFGLITGVHYNIRKDTLTFLLSADEGQTWRSVNFPVAHPLINHGIVVFTDGNNELGAFVRNQYAVDGDYLQTWTAFSQFAPVNQSSVKRFEDLKWKGSRTNIWMRKDDSYGAQYNPVSKRIEVVATKREWGEPYFDKGYMTLGLWSITPNDFQNLSNRWRYDGTLLRSVGEKSRVDNPRDGMHPAGTVIDERQGLQHVFFYSGNRSHGEDGAPDIGRTGIFRLSRTLDTEKWVTTNSELDPYMKTSTIDESFNDLVNWEKSGSPTGDMKLSRTEPASRTTVKLPNGTMVVKQGILSVKTNEPGYYGLHNEHALASSFFKMEFKAKLTRFPPKGYPLGVHVNTGAEKFDLLFKQDGVYQLTNDKNSYRRIINIKNDKQWHTWLIIMNNATAKIYKDGIYIGKGATRLDGIIGHYPLTISAVAASKTDLAEAELDYLKYENVVVPDSGTVTNSLDMKMVKLNPGEFLMGNEGEINYKDLLKDEPHTPFLAKGAPNPYIKNGPVMNENPLEWDEKPAHTVKLTETFYMSATPVTNAQYEQFRPEHRSLRGKSGFSKNDDDAVLYVSWEEAVAFTKWLSRKEGENYRLPTEAEWEYATRAGTRTAYFTGDSLPKEYWQHQVMNRSHSIKPDSVNLKVATNAPNAWGLYNMHGLVEEWCADWYGPYDQAEQTNPVGARSGIAKVTRGGSHSTGLPYLRSANRSGALPGTKSFLIGFRVVKAKEPGPVPGSSVASRKWASGVNQQKSNWSKTKVLPGKAVFERPKTYTRVDPGSNGPLYFIHNHEPALTVLPNGDLLAIWFTTTLERGREMIVAGARLRKGAREWDKPDIFFQVPDRNLTGQALWWDGDKTIYHFSGVSVADDWERLSLVMRKSTDNGVTWSKPEIIGPEYKNRHQVIDAVMKSKDGSIVLLCDADPSPNGGTSLHISTDGGKTWNDPGLGKPLPEFKEGKTGSWIAGIHGGIVELKDGSWMALGRGDAINGTMPMSISKDKGRTWQYFPTSLTPIKSAQRLALTRLQEGPILLVSFEQQMTDIISNGKKTKGIGMYAALSYDEGKTWPVRKLVTPGEGDLILDAPCNYRWGKEVSVLNKDHAERRGYLTVEQAPDGMIHLLSSGTHYSFNIAWILEP